MALFNHLVVEAGEELHDINLLLEKVWMPTVDLDAVLAQVFGSISVIRGSQDELYRVAAWLASGEGLCEGPIEGSRDLGHEKIVFETFVRFAKRMRDHLLEVGAYDEHGQFRLQYREVINNDLIHFVTPGTPHPPPKEEAHHATRTAVSRAPYRARD